MPHESHFIHHCIQAMTLKPNLKSSDRKTVKLNGLVTYLPNGGNHWLLLGELTELQRFETPSPKLLGNGPSHAAKVLQALPLQQRWHLTVSHPCRKTARVNNKLVMDAVILSLPPEEASS